MREDNLLCLRKSPFVPMTTDSRHDWCIVPNLARGLQLTDIDHLWVADITYVHPPKNSHSWRSSSTLSVARSSAGLLQPI
ncbi:hypothetical protein AJ87_20935 [Rhizobium yanglingense]|nr:hypothetical protein AJ87_20935 [Rhizobium yanglingense]